MSKAIDPTLEKLVERLKGESMQAYAAFLHYAALHPRDRVRGDAVTKIAKEFGYTEGTLMQYHHAYSWADRASMIDAQNWMLENQKRQDELSADNKRFIEQSRTVKEESLKSARKMLSVANNLLDNAELSDKLIETDFIETNDGRRVPQYTTIQMKAKISDIPRLVDTAVKVSRLAAELPTEIIENDLPRIMDLQNLSDEELQVLRETNNQKLLERGAMSKIGNQDLGEIS